MLEVVGLIGRLRRGLDDVQRHGGGRRVRVDQELLVVAHRGCGVPVRRDHRDDELEHVAVGINICHSYSATTKPPSRDCACSRIGPGPECHVQPAPPASDPKVVAGAVVDA